MADLAAGHQLLGHRSGLIDRDGEAKARPRAGAHQGVDANDLPVGVEQGPTGITGINGGVGLNQLQPLIGDPQRSGVAVQVADDPQGHGLIQAEGIAHRDHPFAHLQGIGIAQGGHGPRTWPAQADHREVRDAVTADNLALHPATVGQTDHHPRRALDDVGIGQQQARGVVDHPTPLAPLSPLGGRNPGRSAPGRQPEKLPQHRVVKREGRNQGSPWNHDRALRIDRHDRRAGALHRLGHKGLTGQGRRRRALGCNRWQSQEDGASTCRQQKAGHPCCCASHGTKSKSAKP